MAFFYWYFFRLGFLDGKHGFLFCQMHAIFEQFTAAKLWELEHYKRDARDGQLKLIECNPRFTAANEEVRYAGIDLALFAYSRVVGLPTPSVDSFRDGVRLWLPIEDLLAYRSYRRLGTLSLSEWVGSLLHRQHFPIFRRDDPLPSLDDAGCLLGIGRDDLHPETSKDEEE